MIPLLLQEDYKPKGWLGLLMGSRMYYSFVDALHDDAAAWTKRVDSVVFEIGGRGALPLAAASSGVPEGIPPLPAALASHDGVSGNVTPLPPARVHVAAPDVATLEAAPTALPASPSRDETQATPGATPGRSSAGRAGSAGSGSTACASLSDISTFFREVRQAANLERAELKAELKAELGGVGSLPPPAAALAFSEEQFARMQSRLESIHAANLISDEELFGLEDFCGDVIELESLVGSLRVEMALANELVAKARKLVALSEKLVSDAAFARQLRRRIFA